MIFNKIRFFTIIIFWNFASSFSFDPFLEINLISADHTIRDPTHPTKCLKSHKFKQVRLVECPTELSNEYLWEIGGKKRNLIESKRSKDGLSHCWSASLGKSKTKLRMSVCNETDVEQQFELFNGIVKHAGQDVGDLRCFVSGVKSGQLRFKKCVTSRFGDIDPSVKVTTRSKKG